MLFDVLMLTCVQTIFLEARTIFLHMNRVSQRTNSNNAKTNNVSWFMNAMCDATIPVHKMHTFHINIQIGLNNPHFLQMMMITHSYSLRKYPTSQQQQQKSFYPIKLPLFQRTMNDNKSKFNQCIAFFSAGTMPNHGSEMQYNGTINLIISWKASALPKKPK